MTTPPGQPGWDRPPHGRPGADEPDPAQQQPDGSPYDPSYAPAPQPEPGYPAQPQPGSPYGANPYGGVTQAGPEGYQQPGYPPPPPGSNYPASAPPYPASAPPASQYPGSPYPASAPPASNYPASAPPASQYPASAPPAPGNYPPPGSYPPPGPGNYPPPPVGPPPSDPYAQQPGYDAPPPGYDSPPPADPYQQGGYSAPPPYEQSAPYDPAQQPYDPAQQPYPGPPDPQYPYSEGGQHSADPYAPQPDPYRADPYAPDQGQGYPPDPYAPAVAPVSGYPRHSAHSTGLPAVPVPPSSAPPHLGGRRTPLDGPPRLAAPEEPGSRKLLVGLIAGAVVLVLIVVGTIAGFMLFSGDDGGNDQAQTPSTSSSPSAAPPSSAAPSSAAPTTPGTTGPDKLDSRASDPQPLALAAISKPSYTLSTSGTYQRTGNDQAADCTKSVDGAAVALVAKLKCSEVTSVTAVNLKSGCVVTFGALNLPDAATAQQAENAIKGGSAGSFVPRRHNVGTEGQSGRKDWWFYRKAYGHWLVFSTGAYASGKVAAKDSVIDTCSQDFLYYVIDVLDKRR